MAQTRKGSISEVCAEDGGVAFVGMANIVKSVDGKKGPATVSFGSPRRKQ